METTILNVVYRYNSSNPIIELFINHPPFELKINQTFFNSIISLKSIHLEKLIGSKIKYEFLNKGEKLNIFSSEICKYENSYLRYIEFDKKYILENQNEIKFSKVTRKEFYFAKIDMGPDFVNYYKYMYVPKLNLYSGSTLISKIDIRDKLDFYICLFTEVNICRIKGCGCESCLENKSDNIDNNEDDITIDVRIEASDLKKIKNLNSEKNKKMNELCRKLYLKTDRTFSSLDKKIAEELNLFIKNQ